MTDTTHEEKEKDQSKEIHVHENGNKNIMIIDGTQSAAASSTYALFFSSSFSSRRHAKLTFSLVHIQLLQAIRQQMK